MRRAHLLPLLALALVPGTAFANHERSAPQADWRAIEMSANETLVNSLCMISPYGAREKQALLEARTLEDRNQMLIALTEVALAQSSPNDAPVQ